MDENAKLEIQAALSILKSALVRNMASIAVTDEGKLLVFDTRRYIESGKMFGFSTNLDGLVK